MYRIGAGGGVGRNININQYVGIDIQEERSPDSVAQMSHGQLSIVYRTLRDGLEESEW